MKRDIVFKLHKSSNSVVEIYTFNRELDEILGEVYAIAATDLLDDLSDELASYVEDGKQVQCRLEIVNVQE